MPSRSAAVFFSGTKLLLCFAALSLAMQANEVLGPDLSGCSAKVRNGACSTPVVF